MSGNPNFDALHSIQTAKKPTVSEEEMFSVVLSFHYKSRFDQLLHAVEIRKYGRADGPAVYQEWIDGKFKQTLAEPHRAKQPEVLQSADNLVRSQNMYCVNISTSHGPVSYFHMKDNVSPETMRQRERAEYLAHVNRVKNQHAARHPPHKQGHSQKNKGI